MSTAFGNDIGHNQTYRRQNLNFSDGDFALPIQHNLGSIKPDIAPHWPSPKYPQYNSLPDRLDTFRSWPLARPGPLQLAQEGLYYSGEKDQTVCYYCGGALSSWGSEDDPEREHEHWYPNCELVKRRKKQTANSSTKSISFSKQQVHPEDRMNSAAVQSVIEYGYTPENIKKAVDHLTMTKGKVVFNAVELMEILDNFDDNEKSDKDLSDSAKPSEFDKRSETGNYTDSSLSSSLTSSVSSSNEVKHVQVEEKKKLDAKTLIEENQRLRDMALCKICMDKSSCIVFLPCGHMVCCASCSPAMRKCPICREIVRATVKAFMA
ncbi:hypothetical protein CHS0354_018897 [Potamilus streckersoni]|uniref:RING-type domain-containing protein n=1 Tax=Potamilus streckersoni TaxID=2493646 RepID=A0AAE0VT83_9BIVA|nr:hypothetical protein CHS0354_018897 [Potamilus streckersoni]